MKRVDTSRHSLQDCCTDFQDLDYAGFSVFLMPASTVHSLIARRESDLVSADTPTL